MAQDAVQEMIQEQEVYRVLGANYESIFVVDLIAHTIRVIRKNDKLPQVFWDLLDANPNYDYVLEYYVSHYVVEEDRARVIQFTNSDILKQILKNLSVYSYDYRIMAPQGSEWLRMRIAKMNSEMETTCFVVGCENVSAERKYEAEFYRTGEKILVVDENAETKLFLRATVEQDFDFLEADTIEEGLKLLEDNCKDIALVFINLAMAGDKGFLFLKKISGVRRYGSIPIIGMAREHIAEDEAKALELGAADFIHMPLRENVIQYKIRSLIRLRTSAIMMNSEEKDPLTGLYNRAYFYKYADELIRTNPDKEYWFVISDIEKFKVINEKYGITVGDEILKHIAVRSAECNKGYVMGGRIGGDVFAFLQTAVVVDHIAGNKLMQDILKGAPVPNLVFKLGVYKVDRTQNISVQMMCDRARMALERIKGVYGRHCNFYDEKLREDAIIRQQIVECMDGALQREEFQVYLQPKYDVKENRVGGAEALVRWIHPDMGFMSPGVFIPIFEQNNFILELDRYVLAKVCKILRRWLDEGVEAVPISVNLSRKDFTDGGLAQYVIDITNQYKIPHELIHLELTESAFSENPGTIADTIRALRESGFAIELDDFGTGYSSMTTLNSIDIDILKLDMSIIQNDVPGSDRNVLDFCMQLAKMMKLKTVAEGAETAEQTERLKALGCDYVQGYYYSKPLPIVQFEDYVKKMEQTV